MRNSIVQNIEKYMEEKNFSQVEIAREVKVTSDVVYNILHGRTEPTKSFLLELANSSNRTIDSFVFSRTIKYYVALEVKKIIEKLNRTEKITALLYVLCIRYRIMDYYSEEEIDKIFKSGNVGYLIKLQRLIRNIEVEDLTKELSYNEKSVRNIESNDAGISLSNMILLAEKWKIPIDYFFVGSLKNVDYVVTYLIQEVFGEISVEEKKLLADLLSSYARWTEYLRGCD